MNKKTKALTTEQYKEIIQTMREVFCGTAVRPSVAYTLRLFMTVASVFLCVFPEPVQVLFSQQISAFIPADNQESCIFHNT